MDYPGKIILAASLGLLVWSFYKAYLSKSDHEKSQLRLHKKQQQHQQLDSQIMIQQVENKMRKLKLQKSSSIRQCKQALLLTFQYTLNKLRVYNIKMKKRRRQAQKHNAILFEQYLKLLTKGIEESRRISIESRNYAYQIMNINDQTIDRNSQQQLKNEGVNNLLGLKNLSLHDLKKIIFSLVQFYRQRGSLLADQIASCVLLWTHKNKQLILKVLSLIVVDLALADIYPDIDQMDIEYAKKKYQDHLQQQFQLLAQEQSKFYQLLQHKIFQQY